MFDKEIVFVFFGIILIALMGGLVYMRVSTPVPIVTKNPAYENAVPSEISALFGKLNSGLSSNFVPTENVDADKKSWTIDFTSAVKEKAQIVIVRNLLEKELTPDITKSAAGAGQTIDAYKNENIECYLILGLDQKDLLTCASR